jgi:hypothetical protein
MACHRFDLVSKALSTAPTIGGVLAAHPALSLDQLFVVDGTAIKALGAGDALAGRWRSKLVVYPWPEGYGWIRVNGPAVEDVTVRYYLDGVLVHTSVFTNRSPQRLPALKAHRIELELEAAERITSVAVAKTPQELGT